MTLWVTSDRVEPAAGPAMSASHPKRPSAMKMRTDALGGPSQPIAAQQFFGRYWGTTEIGLRWASAESVATLTKPAVARVV